LAAAALRLKRPRVMLGYWQALLAGCLLLPLVEPWQEAVFAPAGSSATIIGTRTAGADSFFFLLSLSAWVLLLLAAGASLGLLRLVLGIWRLGHYRRAARLIAPLPDTLREAEALVGIRPRFYYSDRVESPVTFGWVDPAIIFPCRFARLEEGHQRAIACHELLHVARRDWLMNLFEEVILTLFWFHPAVWWVLRSIRLSREQVVDSQVVALTGARKPYLHALLEIAATTRASPVPAPLFLVESQLARRIALLVKEVRMSKPRLVASLVIALAVLAAAGWWGVKTFWLTAPLEHATHVVGYASASPPGSDVPSTFMFSTVGGDVSAPVPIYKPDPPYTPQARKDKVQGVVAASVGVDASGSVASVKVIRVSLSRDLSDGLDQSVVDTVRTWKFKPALKKGKPVPVMVVVDVSFKMF